MRKIIAVWLLTILTVSAIEIVFPININSSESQVNFPLYTTHDPIYINGNADFIAENGVSNPGAAGTEVDPYIIEEWDINASSANGIEIRNTDAHFIIRDCYVYNGKNNLKDGLYFNNVKNGSIENTSSFNNWDGIELDYSSNNNISNNIVSNNEDGIDLYYSSYNNISSNNALNRRYGIILQSSSYNNISNNSPSNNEYGIKLSSSSNNNIFNNTASNNWYGIRLQDSGNNNIFTNNASNNLYGICLRDSNNNNIHNNIANLNDYFSIYLKDWSDYNNVYNNNVSNNSDGICVLDSSYNYIFNNTALGNFYGISLGSSNNNNIINNIVNSNVQGNIHLYSSSYNNISNNNANSSNNGIELEHSSNRNLVYNNIASNDYMGISLYHSSNNSIFNNIASNNKYGIYLRDSSYSNISNNTASDNSIFGIYLRDLNYSNICNNTLENEGIIIYGYTTGHFTTHYITNNTVNNKPIYYYKNQSNNSIDGWSAGQIILANCTNFTIKNVDCSDASGGVELAYCKNCSIENSTFNNETYGIYLIYSSNNNVLNNSFLSNWFGVYISRSSSNKISYNYFSKNSYGVYSKYSSYDSIFNNEASNNYVGIHLEHSSINAIYNNSASNNWRGIWLYGSICNNISNNSASNNYLGFYPEISHDNNILNNTASNNYYGIYLRSSSNNTFISNNISYNSCSMEISDSDCGNNAFHHNNFINGTVVCVIDNGENTKWDDVFGEGNYWSNYNGLDDGSNGRIAGDGVGDTNIPHMGLDNYPLMEPVEPPYIPDTTPPLISFIVVSKITETSAIVTWTTDEFSDSRVNYSHNEDLSFNSTQHNSTMTTNHSITLTDLSPKTTHYFEVSSIDKYGNTAIDTNNSNYFTFTTSDTTPPTIIDVTAISDPQEIYGYVNISAYILDNVEVDTALIDITDPNGGIVGNFTMSYDSIDDRYYKNQTYDIVGTYQFIIWTNDTSNNWNFSSDQFTIQDTTPPAKPTGLMVIPLRSGDLNITWNLNTDDTQTYSIYSNKTVTWVSIANVTYPQNWYIDTGLASGTTYYYNISAWDEVPLESPKSVVVYGVSSPIGTISGTIKDKDGNLIGGTTITIYESGTTTNPVNSTITNGNGEYSIDVPSGTYDVKIEKSGYDTQWEKDVEVTADQTTTTDLTLPLKTDTLGDYWWLILLIIIIIVTIIIITLIAKKKKPIETEEVEEKIEEP